MKAYGGMEVQLHAVLPRHLVEVSGQFQVIVDLPEFYGDKENNLLLPINEIRLFCPTCTLVTTPTEIFRLMMMMMAAAVQWSVGHPDYVGKRVLRNSLEAEPARGNSETTTQS
jgi:hypothetical protein